MDRILQGRSAVLTRTFYVNSEPADPSPDSVTVTVRNSAGDALYEDAAALDTGEGTVSFPLTPSDTAQLDRLTVTWAAKFEGHDQEFVDTVEIAGATLFTIAELRGRDPALEDTDTYPDEAIARVRVAVEQALERHLGYALVPRFTVRQVGPGSRVRLRPFVRALRAATSGGVALTAGQLGSLTVDGAWTVTGFTWSIPASISYEHGLDGDDEEARQHALTLAKAWLINGPIDSRTTVLASPDAGITQTLATPGRGGSIFGIPSVDEFVIANREAFGA